MDARTRFAVVVLTALALALGILVVPGIVRNGDGDAAGSTTIGRLERSPSLWGSAPRVKAGGKRQAKNAAQDATQQSQTAANDWQSSVTITGTICEQDGKPLEGAKFTVRTANDSFNKSFQTDKSGHFNAEGIPAGTYDLLAAHTKYVTMMRPSFTAVTGSGQYVMDFKLPLGIRITGTITDEDGKPLSKARIAARNNKARQSSADAGFIQDDTTYKIEMTTGTGHFTLDGVSIGQNLFEFSRSGYEQEQRKLDIQAATADQPLKIILRKTGLLAGMVVDEEGRPVSTATVHLIRYKPFKGDEERIEKGKISAVSGLDGKFKFGKLYNEGFYDLQVEDDRFAPGIYPLIAVGNQGVMCSLEKGGAIDGSAKFIDRATTPASILVAAQTVIKGTTFTAEVKSDGLGKFAFGHLPYGTYKLYSDSAGIVSEPKDGVACQRTQPTKDVLLEVYEAAIVKGRVADNSDEAPVAGASVTVTASYGPGRSKTRQFQAKSDAHGEFEFRTLPSGAHTASATARGYVKSPRDRSQQQFLLTAAERKGDLVLLLDHGGSIEGFVMDVNGRSIEGCDIQLYPASNLYGQINAAALKSKTDVTGYFRIWGIQVGERAQLYASVRKKGYAKVRSELLDLTPNQSDLSTKIILTNGGGITGKVTDLGAFPIPGAEIKFTSSAFPGDPTPSVVVSHAGPDGSYHIKECTAGSGAVEVSRSGYVKQSRGVTVKSAELTDRTDFKLQGGRRIAGKVESLVGKPIAGAKVTAAPIEGAAGSDEDLTDKNGDFELTNLGEGAFQLTTTFQLTTADGAQNYNFVKKRVRTGADGIVIECDLSNSTTAKVVDSDGRYVKRFTMSLRSRADTKPTQDFTFNLDRSLGDANGYFRVLNIPRGLYSLRIVADGYEPYADQDVAIGPHEKTTLSSIRLKTAGGISGSIFSTTTNRPVSAASVRLTQTNPDPGKTPQQAAGNTDISGEFRITSVPPGTYNVSIDHPSYIGGKVEKITVNRKRQTDIGRHYLEAGGAIRGTIVDDYGQPVPSMHIRVSGVTPAKEAHTDFAGNFLVQGVRAGRWPVVAKGTLNSRMIYTFQTVDVQRDETQKADFRLNTAADLDGMIATASESPVKSGSISIHPFDENQTVLESVRYGANVANQRFSIRQVPTGHYFLWAAGYGAAGTYAAFKELFLDRGMNQTTMQISSAKVQGTVTDASGAPVANLPMHLNPLIENLKLPQSLYDKLVRLGTTSESGIFSFEYLQAGAYQLLNQTPSGSWFAQQPFTIQNNQQATGYDIQTGH